MTSREEFVQGMRQLADTLEANPELPLPYGMEIARVSPPGDMDPDVKPEYIKRRLAQLARLLPGKVDKQVSDIMSNFQLVTHFGPIQYLIEARREYVCEQVTVGQRTETVEEVDREAYDQLPKKTVEKTVDVVEWRCPDTLLGAYDGDADRELSVPSKELPEP